MEGDDVEFAPLGFLKFSNYRQVIVLYKSPISLPSFEQTSDPPLTHTQYSPYGIRTI
jgi:hypothetical protein